MNDTNDLEFAAYVAHLISTIIYVFHRSIPPDALIEWLRPMVTDRDQCELLMHEQPLYVAADFLAIDRDSPDFGQYETAYLNLRANFLRRKDAAAARTPSGNNYQIISKNENYYLQQITPVSIILPLAMEVRPTMASPVLMDLPTDVAERNSALTAAIQGAEVVDLAAHRRLQQRRNAAGGIAVNNAVLQLIAALERNEENHV
jgi:hypothetical protein